MSYILDALRKSEKRRNRSQDGQEPLHTTRISTRPDRDARRRTGALILTGCMLLAVIILAAGWWWVADDGNGGKRGDSAALQFPVLPAQTPSDSTAGKRADAAPAGLATGQAEPAEHVRSTDAPPKQDAPAASVELSASIQERIAEMSFNGHVYSPTPSLRMIMIDEVVVREGDTVYPGLVLSEITDSGLIMQSGSRRFTVDLF